MRYEIRIAEKIGPLLTAALEDMRVTRVPPRTLLAGVRDDPSAVLPLVRRLHSLGVAVDRVRITRVSAPVGREPVSAGEPPQVAAPPDDQRRLSSSAAGEAGAAGRWQRGSTPRREARERPT